MKRRPRARRKVPVDTLMADTQELVGRLIAENRALRAQNARLLLMVDRLSQGWEDLRRLARSAPRAVRRG